MHFFVFKAPFANTRSVAELVLAEMIMLARQAGDRSMECHQGKWNKVHINIHTTTQNIDILNIVYWILNVCDFFFSQISSRCYEVRGKTVGIIGYGHVGSQLSVLAEALGITLTLAALDFMWRFVFLTCFCVCDGIGMYVLFYDIIPKLPLGNARAAASLGNDTDIFSHPLSLTQTHRSYYCHDDSMLEELMTVIRPRGNRTINKFYIYTYIPYKYIWDCQVNIV